MNTSPRILIIEGNLNDEVLLMRQLQKADLAEQVKIFTDGKSAIEYLTNQASECDKLIALFLDLKLPLVNGLQVLENIRSQTHTRHLPVIVMTSSNTPEDLERCRALGVTSYVEKPITFTAFARAVADSFHARLVNPDQTRLAGLQTSMRRFVSL